MATADLTFAFNDSSNDATNPTGPTIDIYQPDGTLDVDGGALDQVATITGIYEYTYTPTVDGVHYYYVHGTVAGNTPVKAGAFTARENASTIRPGIVAQVGETIRVPFGVNDSSGNATAVSAITVSLYKGAETSIKVGEDISANTGGNTGEFFATFVTAGEAAGWYRMILNVSDGTDTPKTVANISVATTVGDTPSISSVSVRPSPPLFDKDFAIVITTSATASEVVAKITDSAGKVMAIRNAAISGTDASALFPAGTAGTSAAHSVTVLATIEGAGDQDTGTSFTVSDTFEPELGRVLVDIFRTSIGTDHEEVKISTKDPDEKTKYPVISIQEVRSPSDPTYLNDPIRMIRSRYFIRAMVSNRGSRMDSYLPGNLTASDGLKARLEALDKEVRRIIMANKDNPRAFIKRLEYRGSLPDPAMVRDNKERVLSTRHDLSVIWWDTNI